VKQTKKLILDSSNDDFSNEEDVLVTAVTKKAKPKPTKKSKVSKSDDDDDDVVITAVTKKAKTKPEKSKPQV